MKRLICAVVLCLFSATMVGCEASAKVGDDDTHGTSYSKKTTTVRESDGDVKTRTEVHTNP